MEKKESITVIDYGMGNINSIANMIKKVGGRAQVSSEISDIKEATKLILPGVGAFDNGMTNLNKSGLSDALTEQVIEKGIPVLGICLGMQLLTKDSEEGHLPGLGWIDAHTRRFSFSTIGEKLKIPHMGWNTVKPKEGSPLFSGFDPDMRFYFVHSYHCVCKNIDDVAGTTLHGYDFTSAVQHRNIFGTQFHPEKSHRFGMHLMRNFVNM